MSASPKSPSRSGVNLPHSGVEDGIGKASTYTGEVIGDFSTATADEAPAEDGDGAAAAGEAAAGEAAAGGAPVGSDALVQLLAFTVTSDELTAGDTKTSRPIDVAWGVGGACFAAA